MKFLDFFHCNILKTNSFLYFHPLDHTTGNVELEEKTKLAIKSNYGASVSIWLKKNFVTPSGKWHENLLESNWLLYTSLSILMFSILFPQYFL